MITRRPQLRIGLVVPAVVLRLFLVVLAVGAAFTSISAVPLRVVAIVGAVIGAVLPHTLCGWAPAGVVAVGVLITHPSPSGTAVAVALIHGIHVLASLSLTIPLGSWVSLRALWPSARRFVIVQVLSQAAALLAGLVLVPRSAPGNGWIEVGAAVVLLCAAAAAWREARTEH